MSLILIVGVTVLAWGTWLLPAQRVAGASATVIVFYTTLANLLIAGVVALGRPEAGLTWGVFLAVMGGGAAWALSGVCAFRATARLGPGRAMGLWSPINILVSLAWGALWFGEFSATTSGRLAVTALGVGLLLGGLRQLLRAGDERDPLARPAAGTAGSGLLWALGAGVLWGSYFVPLRASGASTWAAAWPLAVGTFTTAALILALRRESPLLPHRRDAWPLLAGGTLWSAGNYGSLLLMERIGPGRGFSVAQLCLVVNALCGIHFLRRPAPGTAAARHVLFGCGLAALGGVLLGVSS